MAHNKVVIHLQDQIIQLQRQNRSLREKVTKLKAELSKWHQLRPKARLSRKKVIEDLLSASEDSTNTKERETWVSLFQNQYFEKLSKEKGQEYLARRGYSIRFMFDWFARMASVQSQCRCIYQLSFVLDHYGCPQAIWDVLRYLRLVYSRNVVKEAKKLLLPPLLAQPKFSRQDGDLVAFIGIDNCHYYNGRSAHRINNDPLFKDTLTVYQAFVHDGPDHNEEQFRSLNVPEHAVDFVRYHFSALPSIHDFIRDL